MKRRIFPEADRRIAIRFMPEVIALFAKTVLFQHPASVRSRPGRK